MALYVPLTGAGPSIQRAGVMGAAGLVAALAGRPAHRWYALGLAAAATLALNPRAVGEPGWQLSFAAVVALLALAPPLRGVLARRMPDPVADVAAITIAATVGTAPLMALHFEQVSLAALPANLLAAVAIAPAMWLGMLGAAAAQVAPALAVPFNVVNAPLLAFVEWVAHTLGAAPAAVLPVRLGSPAALAGAYAALAAALVGLRAAWRRMEPASWLTPDPAERRRRVVAALVAAPVVALGLVAAVDVGSVEPPVRGELVVSFLDVGQGDATLLQKDGVAVLVDTGPPGGPDPAAAVGGRRTAARRARHHPRAVRPRGRGARGAAPRADTVDPQRRRRLAEPRAGRLAGGDQGAPDRGPCRPGAHARGDPDAAPVAAPARS